MDFALSVVVELVRGVEWSGVETLPTRFPSRAAESTTQYVRLGIQTGANLLSSSFMVSTNFVACSLSNTYIHTV
jgi:hypothetical protein